MQGISLPGLVLRDERSPGFYIGLNLKSAMVLVMEESLNMDDLLAQAKNFVDRRHKSTMTKMIV